MAALAGRVLGVAVCGYLMGHVSAVADDVAPPSAAPAKAAPAKAAPAKVARPRGEVWWIPRQGEVPSPGRFARPSAVDCAPDGRCLVADKGANRIVVYDAAGSEKKRLVVAAPEDADFLPGGGYLVVSAAAKAVLELDPDGATVWKYDGLGRPLDADRLANGNTLIADAQPPRVLEVDRAGSVVWSHEDGMLQPWDVELSAGGDVLVADYNRHEVRCIRRDGSTCWRVSHIGHPSSLHVLADGALLVGTHKAGSIVHIGSDHRVTGQWPLGRDLEDFALDVEITSGLAARFTTPRERLLVAQFARPEAPLPARARRAAAVEILDRLRAGPPPAAPRGVRRVRGVETQGKNLILILFDSLRQDHVPWHGYWRDTAPHLAALARSGVVFEQFITQAPWTKPSVASLLTSTHASVHGAISQKPQSQLPVSLVTIAEALSSAGYYTAAVMQNPHMGDRNSTKGFEQGYQTYTYVGPKVKGEDRTVHMATTAIDLLANRPSDAPFFLTMFFMNPHYPYDAAHKAFGDKGAGPSNPGPLNDYDAEILEADEQVGRVLEYLAQNDAAGSTIVVFTSDHGEEFGDHGARFHGDTLYDCVIHAPLVMSGLGWEGRFPGLVRTVDMLPTLLDFLGVPQPPELGKQISGVSVRPFLEAGVETTGLIAYSESKFRDNVHLVSERSETRKVIADFTADRARIFDLRTDPQEYNDIATAEESARELARLRRWEEGHREAPPDEGPPEPVSEADLERLRAAGYLGE
jgi:arylsulfatase A-like enzyme